MGLFKKSDPPELWSVECMAHVFKNFSNAAYGQEDLQIVASAIGTGIINSLPAEYLMEALSRWERKTGRSMPILGTSDEQKANLTRDFNGESHQVALKNVINDVSKNTGLFLAFGSAPMCRALIAGLDEDIMELGKDSLVLSSYFTACLENAANVYLDTKGKFGLVETDLMARSAIYAGCVNRLIETS